MDELLELSKVAEMTGELPDTLKKRCQRGKFPGAVRVQNGRKWEWRIPATSVQLLASQQGTDEYAETLEAWKRAQAAGLVSKKPISPRGVDANVYGIEKFWEYLWYIPKDERPADYKIKTGGLQDINQINLEKALANVPIDRKARNCHFSIRDQMYKGVRSFYKYLIRQGLRSKTEFSTLNECKPVRIYEERRKVTDEAGVIKMLEANRKLLSGRAKAKQDFYIHQTEVIIYLAAMAGLRREEIVDLEVGHVRLDALELDVIDGKGNKNRTVGFPPDMAYAIREWLKYRPKSKHKNLLLTDGALPLVPDMVYRKVRTIANAAKITVDPHGLRRTSATIDIEQGVPIEYVKEKLGHASSDTTRQYVMLEKKKVVEAYKKRKGFMTPAKPGQKNSRLDRLSALDEF